MPQPPICLVDVITFHQLRKDWEAAFAVQSQHGKSAVHQISFLENLVLDLQKQLSFERESGKKLSSTVEELLRSSKQIQSQQVQDQRRIKELENSKDVYRKPMLELERKVDSKIAQLNESLKALISAQIQTLEASISTQVNSIQSALVQHAALGKEEAGKLSETLAQEQNQANAAIKDSLTAQSQTNAGVKESIESTVRELQISTKDQIAELKRSGESCTRNLEEIMSKHAQFKRFHHQEQQTLLSVIKSITEKMKRIG